MLYILLGLAFWIVFNLGFLLGCWWAGRKRSGVRERATDSPALPPETSRAIWQRIRDRLAVEHLINTL